MKFPVALQLYSVRDAMEQDFEGTLQKVSEMGYDGVEFAGLFDHSAAEIKALTAKYNLVPISAHVPYYDMVEDPAGVLGVYAEIGCKYVAVPYLTEERRPGTDGFDETVAGIRKIAEAAKELGITLLYHNHDFEFVKLDGTYALDVLYNTIPADLLQTEVDTCWVNVAGEDPAGYLRKYVDRSPVVHLKDFVMSGKGKPQQLYKLIGIDDENTAEAQSEEEAFAFRPVGYGVQDFPGILAAAHDVNAKWVVVEQDSPSLDKNSMECAKMSLDYVKTINL